MIPILIIIILSCCAIFVSIFIQAILTTTTDTDPFDFENYSWESWFVQIIWWILQLALFIWGMIELYPTL